ncbi:MAG: hypothetical protein PHD60_07595 [Clostridia bacterium]|nr:hypothetical protein [Clostridia bacterium]
MKYEIDRIEVPQGYHRRTTNLGDNIELYKLAVSQAKNKFEKSYMEQFGKSRLWFSSAKNREKYCNNPQNEISLVQLDDILNKWEHRLWQEVSLAKAWVCYRNGDNVGAVLRNIAYLEEKNGNEVIAKEIAREIERFPTMSNVIDGLEEKLRKAEEEVGFEMNQDYDWEQYMKTPEKAAKVTALQQKVAESLERFAQEQKVNNSVGMGGARETKSEPCK